MNGEISSVVSNKFRNMGVLCALFVVIIHCRPHFAVGSVGWYAKEMLENGICEMAVPFFFSASGYFIAVKIAEGGYKDEIIKRIRTLLVPYCFWLGMYLLLQFMLIGQLLVAPITQLGLHPLGCPTLTPLWYVRALCCLVLLSPLIVACIKKHALVTLVALGCLYGLVCPYAPLPDWGKLNELARIGPIPVLGLFYFSVGVAIRLRAIRFTVTRLPGAFFAVIGFGLAIVRVVCVRAGVELVGAYCGFASIPFLLYGIWRVIPVSSAPRILATSAFPIYVVHKFFYPLVENWWNKNTLGGYIMTFVGVFVLSLTMACLIRKMSPRFAAVVFGGR